ncbi:MAG: LysM peptidoglycan-binding domain-containing protein, partial [Candidatus Electrothrix sp. AR1]|nr:LysM peptidoglycan-binding domain-containing protein [Candidatus Electrothrix sp. AR1]
KGKTTIQEQRQEQDEEGLVENVHKDEDKPDALSQGRAADDSVDGAADDVVLKSAVVEEKDFVKGSIGASFNDAANKSKDESNQPNVTAALRGIGNAPEELDAAQDRIDKKREKQQQPAPASHSSQSISVNIVRDGQETTVESIHEVGIIDLAGNRSKRIVEDRVTVPKSEEGLVGNVHEDNENPDALPQGRAADDSGNGAADDVVLKSAVSEEKDFIKGSIGASSDDAANKSKETVQDGATGHVVKEEKKQADELLLETASGSTQVIPAASTEKNRRYVDQEKTTDVDLSKERTTPADQKSSPLISPVNSDHTSHTVSKGDTLWEISKQYTGSGFNYPDVAKKNKIDNPDMIYPNQQVILPADK